MSGKPFVKWAGGKNQLLPEIRARYPQGLGHTVHRYCEPFVGGGAVLFDVLSRYQLDEVLINDSNRALTGVYRQVKTRPHSLIRALERIEAEYLPLSTPERNEYYYQKRERFNHLSATAALERAALFLFLNKTCYNGLFRVNRAGQFNVPAGTYQNPTICDREALLAASALLQNVRITTGDFARCLSFVDGSTFVYVDPPYRPLSATAAFTSYTAQGFDDRQQRRLGAFLDEVHRRGGLFLLSNSDPQNQNPEDRFFDDLYQAYTIERVEARRYINRNGQDRGAIRELLITNF